MRLIGKLIKFQLFIYVTLVAAVFAIFAPVELEEPSELQTGDILLQTSPAHQSLAFILLSQSVYNHAGLYVEHEGEAFVLSTRDKVDFIPFDDWVAHGLGGRYAVFRHASYVSDDIVPMMQAVKPYFRQPNDMLMQRGNPMLYSSELVYELYGAAGKQAGAVQTLEELAGRNRFTKAIAEQLRQVYPGCMTGDRSFEACYESLLSHELITPASLSKGEPVEKIYSNYLGGIL